MTHSTSLAIVLGTRPEIIKLAPVIRACEQRDLEYTLIHTGQHYSESLDGVFFEQLELPTPEYNLEVGSQSHGQQTGTMIAGIEEILLDEEPDTVLVQGDTNSVLAGAIATDKLDIELGHIEAGLRSFDRSMPEESNRRATDHLADYLFAPTGEAGQLLRQEGITDERVFVTGNTVVDAVQQNQEFAQEKSRVLAELELADQDYGLMTAHRAENVDDKARFRNLLDGAQRVAAEFGLEIIYPIHPRAENKLEEFDLNVPPHVRLTEPQDYLDFLQLESNAELILTDSGGIQEEACILGVPCVTMRDHTERPETLEVGANALVGTDTTSIMDGALEMYDVAGEWANPFGDGSAAEQILDIVETVTPPQDVRPPQDGTATQEVVQ
jgi:UDP-N-acetylglucosamine 2-epimerase (non-hydrolysing)